MKSRDGALQEFKENDDIRILLMSIKCGGSKYFPCVDSSTSKCSVVGLNITEASRVIVMDPWWNSAMEQQGMHSQVSPAI